jgi:hypothetical protein
MWLAAPFTGAVVGVVAVAVAGCRALYESPRYVIDARSHALQSQLSHPHSRTLSRTLSHLDKARESQHPALHTSGSSRIILSLIWTNISCNNLSNATVSQKVRNINQLD